MKTTKIEFSLSEKYIKEIEHILKNGLSYGSEAFPEDDFVQNGEVIKIILSDDIPNHPEESSPYKKSIGLYLVNGDPCYLDGTLFFSGREVSAFERYDSVCGEHHFLLEDETIILSIVKEQKK